MMSPSSRFISAARLPRRCWLLPPLLFALEVNGQVTDRVAHGSHREHAEGQSYSRQLASYDPPPVVLVDQEGRRVPLGGILNHNGPIMLQSAYPLYSSDESSYPWTRAVGGEDRVC